MNSNNNNSIGINSFVKRQIQGSGKTYSTLSFEEIRNHAETQLKSNIYKKGYRDGVVLIPIDKKLLKHFICPIVRIDENTIFETVQKRRRNDEEIYLSTKALNGTPIEIGAVDLILYRSDVLEETQEEETDNGWELIAFHAVPKGIKELPMGPITMMRNQLCLTGGTEGKYSSEQWAKSVHFWQKHALLK